MVVPCLEKLIRKVNYSYGGFSLLKHDNYQMVPENNTQCGLSLLFHVFLCLENNILN